MQHCAPLPRCVASKPRVKGPSSPWLRGGGGGSHGEAGGGGGGRSEAGGNGGRGGAAAGAVSAECGSSNRTKRVRSLCRAFGRERLRLVYIGAGFACDLPEKWKGVYLDYYTKPSAELHRRHDVCFAAASLAGIGRCACSMPRPDAVILGWTVWDLQTKASDITFGCLLEAWRRTQSPVIAIMNKEYANVAQKQALVRQLAPSRVLTVVDSRQTEEWTRATGRPHVRWPFAVDCDTFSAKDQEQEYDFDVGFTGIIRSEQTDNWRTRILGRLEEMKQRHNLRVFINFGNYTAATTTAKGGYLVNRYKVLPSEKYIRTLHRTKIWISTTGPADIVGTRYFEVLATGRALLLCNRMPPAVYDHILSSGVHAATFGSLDEFDQQVLHYLEHEEERQRMIAQARRHVCQRHTYTKRITQLEEHVLQITQMD